MLRINYSNVVPSVQLAQLKARIELLMSLETLDQDIANTKLRKTNFMDDARAATHQMESALRMMQRELAFAMYERGMPIWEISSKVDLSAFDIEEMIRREIKIVEEEQAREKLVAAIDPEMAKRKLSSFNLSARAQSHLTAFCVTYVADLALVWEESVYKPGMGAGKKTFDEIRAFMTSINLSFRTA